MGEMRIVGVLVVVNRVKRNILQKSPVVGVLFVVFLVWGCASPPRKTMAPEPLVNEIKPIEGTESTVSSPTPPPTTRKVEAKSPKGGKPCIRLKGILYGVFQIIIAYVRQFVRLITNSKTDWK